MKNGWYMLEIIDRQCKIPNRKHKCGSTHDMRERVRDLRRTIPGTFTIVHWEPCVKYESLESLVKDELKDKLSPCAMQSYCTETYLASKEEILQVMRTCKEGLRSITEKLTPPSSPRSPTQSIPDLFDYQDEKMNF